MRRKTMDYKSLRDRVQTLEKLPENKGTYWQIGEAAYFVSEAVVRDVLKTASTETLRKLAGEEGDDNADDDDGTEAYEWLVREIEKCMTGNHRK